VVVSISAACSIGFHNSFVKMWDSSLLSFLTFKMYTGEGLVFDDYSPIGLFVN